MKQDYKNFVYLRIPNKTFEKILKGEYKPKKEDFEFWRWDYEAKIQNKQIYAKRANKIKIAKTINKLYTTLENYFNGLFREEKELTPYQLSKLAGVNYRTARKFWQEHNLDKWIEEFKQNPSKLKDFKVIELSKYF